MYGSKADNLIALKNAEILVPPFEIVPFNKVISNQLDIEKILQKVSEKDFATQSSVLCAALQKNICKDFSFENAYSQYSVRSSCTLEDGTDSSFAGQFDTFLRVLPEDVPKKIADCVCGLFNENVLQYCSNRKLPLQNLQMHVVVQQMIEADKAGVIFTANPQGILNESVIIVGDGTGENVVTDKTDTTTYYFNRTDDSYYFDGDEDRLSEKTIRSLIETSDKIKNLFNAEMDIEFCIKNDKIYYLQARPITTLSKSEPLIFDNSNIVESYPNLSLPLTISFVERIYAGVFRSASRRILNSKNQMEKYGDIFDHMVGHANGRLYYQISNWYTMLSFLPFHKKIIPVWQEMLGVKNKTQTAKPVHLPPIIRVMTYFNAFSEILFAPQHMKALNKKFDKVYSVFQSEFYDGMPPADALRLTETLETELLADWDITLFNDTYSFINTGLLKAYLKHRYPEDSTSRANRCIASISNIESMKPIRSMLSLAKEKEHISPLDFEKKLEQYIQIYGDRSPEELKLESETFRSNPELLRKQIDAYLSDPEHLNLMTAEHTEEAADNVKNDYITKLLLKRCKSGISNREISRLNRSRIFGMFRTAVLSIGKTFCSNGYIDDVRDIFYLTYDELHTMAENAVPMQEIIAGRKLQYKIFEELPSYSRILFADKAFDKNHTHINAHKFLCGSDCLHGTPCSNGIVEGEALVVEDIHSVQNARGKILVSKMTDPGWVFLLASAKGLACEKGSLLSHSAIISRELKLPAVVGVEGLFKNVQNGDRIRLDGINGTVTILRN